MYKHLLSSLLITVVAVTLTACKALPPQMDTMTDRFVCFHSKNTAEYQDWYKDEVSARGLDCNVLEETPLIQPKQKEKLVSKTKSNQKIPGIPSRFEIFGNASDLDLCKKYTGFLRGNMVVEVSELVGFTFYVDQAGLDCAVTDFQKEYEKRAIPSMYANMHSVDLCLKMTKFAEGKIPLGSTDLTSMEMELNRRQPPCWTGLTLADESMDSDNKSTSQTLNNKGSAKKIPERFERLADAAICMKYDSLFEAGNNMSNEERKALRNQMEKRKLDCSSSRTKVAQRQHEAEKNKVSQSANVERQILAKYGKADEVERLGPSSVFKYCKTSLIGNDSYTYVWSDGVRIKQIYKGKWTSEFLCAGAHRQIDWTKTNATGSLSLVKPIRAPRKSFGEAMAEGMEQSMQSNQGIYNSLIKGGGDTVTCNKLGDMRFPKQVYTFQGSFCPMGYITAF